MFVLHYYINLNKIAFQNVFSSVSYEKQCLQNSKMKKSQLAKLCNNLLNLNILTAAKTQKNRILAKKSSTSNSSVLSLKT